MRLIYKKLSLKTESIKTFIKKSVDNLILPFLCISFLYTYVYKWNSVKK